METLAQVVSDAKRRHAVVLDAAQIVESEVASKRGFRGAALKAGFGAFQRISPGIVPGAVDRLLPHFVPVLDPLWAEAVASGDPEGWFASHDEKVARELLGVTDALAARAKNKVVLRIYQTLRGSAEEHVRQGVPRIPELIRNHIN